MYSIKMRRREEKIEQQHTSVLAYSQLMNYANEDLEPINFLHAV